MRHRRCTWVGAAFPLAASAHGHINRATEDAEKHQQVSGRQNAI